LAGEKAALQTVEIQLDELAGSVLDQVGLERVKLKIDRLAQSGAN
jgi:hypothetical protein